MTDKCSGDSVSASATFTVMEGNDIKNVYVSEDNSIWPITANVEHKLTVSVNGFEKIEDYLFSVPANDIKTINILLTPLETCNDRDDNCNGETDEGFSKNHIYYYDNDKDGYGNSVNDLKTCLNAPPDGYVTNDDDCDDNDPNIKDKQECEEKTWYLDKDGDKYSADSSKDACERPGPHYYLSDELIATSADCNDDDPAINPGAQEICGDGKDNDCDGQADDKDSDCCEKKTWYRDADGDECGNPDDKILACEAPAGYVSSSDDCDDSDPEVCQRTFYRDADGDGCGNPGDTVLACEAPAGYVSNSDDCDDSDPEVCQRTFYRDADGDGCGNPGDTDLACEAPAGYVSSSDDCDDSDPEVCQRTFYRDADGDGCGNPKDTVLACEAPAGYVSSSDDCDDSDPEVCQRTFYRDADGDGCGNPKDTVLACEAPAGYVSSSDDCDDSDPEVCQRTFYRDADGDGFGHDEKDSSIEACEQPDGYAEKSGDCDDTDENINPDAKEICDEADNDCNGEIDECCKTYYLDWDKDSFGDPDLEKSIDSCKDEPPEGYVDNNEDCDDSDPKEKPNQKWYKDADGDKYSSDGTFQTACERPEKHFLKSELNKISGDCDDTDDEVYPDAPEKLDGKDNNCDGEVESEYIYYPDMDGDGYGDSDETKAIDVYSETPPTGCVPDHSDCNDENPDEHPGQLWYKDGDGDKHSDGTKEISCERPDLHFLESELDSTTGDCNDSDENIGPGVEEKCDGKDNNCDGRIDEDVTIKFYRDADGDGYGDAAFSVKGCEQPDGYVENDDDMDDTDPAVTDTRPEYEVLFHVQGSGKIEGNSDQTIGRNGDTESVTAVPESGWRFAEWTGDYIGSPNPLTLEGVVSNMDITALFEAEPAVSYTITATVSDGGIVIPSGAVEVPEGDPQFFTFRPDEGYYLKSVEADGVPQNEISEYRFDNVAENHTLHGVFEFSGGGGGGGGCFIQSLMP
ncbi:MopE-related protein [Desulfonema ishimotonii]|nr:MopE-related protein [Desulfonema ishimotonii]